MSTSQENINEVQSDSRHLVDIEHVFVQDDPRKWSALRKYTILAIIAAASMIATLGANIYNPAIQEIQNDLHATDSEIALSLSLFILVQGNAPLVWSAISEIKGRKIVYLTAITLFVVGCVVVATANSIGLVIGMRCLQAGGSSAVLTVGAGTLADIFDPHERGTMMGIYYAAPLLGPSLGPLIGGILTQVFSWRATFWFLVIFGGISLVSFLFFQDTFRRERSTAYQSALRRALQQAHQRTPGHSSEEVKMVTQPPSYNVAECDKDAEKGTISSTVPQGFADVKLSLRDVNPLEPLVPILRRWNNVMILVPSGFFFALNYSLTYTCARTLSDYYGYNALKTGLVLLAYGVGAVAGSVLGGRWSDKVLFRLKTKNGGQSYPEMRLESTKLGMYFLPPAVIAYAWLCQEKIHIAAVCVSLFAIGFFSIWIYSSTLAYIVDANTGRSSSAVATNSSFRGIAGFVAAEVAVPLQIAIGDGGLYTIWAGLMLLSEILILIVIWKGEKWRALAKAREEAQTPNK